MDMSIGSFLLFRSPLVQDDGLGGGIVVGHGDGLADTLALYG